MNHAAMLRTGNRNFQFRQPMLPDLMESEMGQIRKELLEARNRLQNLETIVDRSPAAFFLWRRAGGWTVELVCGNLAQFGYTQKEFLEGELSWAAIIHPDEIPRLERERKEYDVRGMDTFTQEYRIFTRAGETRWVEDRAVAIRNGMGVTTHYQDIILDVTKRRQLEETLFDTTEQMERLVDERTAELARVNEQLQLDIARRKQAEESRRQLEQMLQQAQKMEAIGTLAGGIAHDFNNILGGIMGFTELALLDTPRGSPAYTNLKHSLKAQRRAVEMVNQILAFSRQTESDPIPLKVAPIVKEVVKLLRMSIPTMIDIMFKNEAALDMVIAEPARIHQILMNLCTNAAHAMQERGGELVVTLANAVVDLNTALSYPTLLPGPYVELSVEDTGHGIDPLIQDRIFDPFFTTKKPGEGTGMGLAMVYGIVKDLKGTIDLESHLGKGTRFRVLIPAIEPRQEEHPVADRIPRGQGRILFVDDEEFLVRIGDQVLTRLGYEVVARTSSVEALEAFRAQPEHFDLVITDLNMPNMTGIDLAKELLDLRSDIPIILCTGFSEQIVEEKARQLGVREFMIKPLIMSTMAKVIKNVLDGQALQRRKDVADSCG